LQPDCLEEPVARSPFADYLSRYDRGEVLFAAGDAGSTLFVVQSGAVELSLSEAGGRLGIMEKGDFFGEMSLLEGTPRTFTARAVEDSEIIEISPALFDRMIRANIELAVRMLRKLSIRLAEVESRLAAPAESSRLQPPPPAPIPEIGDQAPPAAPATPAAAAAPSPAADAPQGAPCMVNPDGSEIFPVASPVVRVGRFDPVTGTRPEVDLTLLDLKRSVSRRHAVLTTDGGRCFLAEEVGAINGTLVNGQQVTAGQPVQIQDGDTLSFGSVTLRFQQPTG
jgi:predicted component of type VI protein secretion system